jgi:multidrug resistance efflux pump
MNAGEKIDPTLDLERACAEAQRARDRLVDLKAAEVTAARDLDRRREAVAEGERALAAAQEKVKTRAAALGGGK